MHVAESVSLVVAVACMEDVNRKASTVKVVILRCKEMSVKLTVLVEEDVCAHRTWI